MRRPKGSLLTIALAFCLLPLSLQGQSLKKLVEAGNEAFELGDYYLASLYYGDALELDDEIAELNYKYAEANRLFNNYDQARGAYTKTASLDKKDEFPLAVFYEGEMWKYMGQYQEARLSFQHFVKHYKTDDFYRQKALHEIEVCEMANELKEEEMELNDYPIPAGVNSPFTEFGASFTQDMGITYSALREEFEIPDGQQYLSRIYLANSELDPGMVSLTYQTNNFPKHAANGSFSIDFKYFYFTVCENQNKTELHCDIYVTHLEGDSWTTPQKLPATVNKEGYTATQPFEMITPDGYGYLLFASNRPGGEGKMDIWASEIKGGTYTEAQNLGAVINTPDDEATPTYDFNTNVLYFSSKWHPGLGGYDIFGAYGTPHDGFEEPYNLRGPINTSYNDLYFSTCPCGDKVLLTSNRVGAKYIKGETCCNDIFGYYADVSKLLPPPPAPPVDTPIVVIDTPEVPTIEDLLPVTVYFHNDEPNPKTLSDTTVLTYQQAYNSYLALKDEYLLEYPKDKADKQQKLAEKEVQDLFKNKVEQGFSDLKAFSELLQQVLEGGEDVELGIQGYCSPLARNAYNINLAERRIASLKNYFYAYNNGALMPFIKNEKLTFYKEPYGEELADKSVSDSPTDIQNSIYNPAAAAERKVSIISAKLSGGEE